MRSVACLWRLLPLRWCHLCIQPHIHKTKNIPRTHSMAKIVVQHSTSQSLAFAAHLQLTRCTRSCSLCTRCCRLITVTRRWSLFQVVSMIDSFSLFWMSMSDPSLDYRVTLIRPRHCMPQASFQWRRVHSKFQKSVQFNTSISMFRATHARLMTQCLVRRTYQSHTANSRGQ
jgi:hypothetical protein